ncbi:unnamed protein product [Meganyctiphanes norvegica]|uniref:Uncharacterized protein n=1 Tax=Meganyctiphanes norvegica TaxID=48144 RepID=A0AAV2QIV8_MEGNR
MSEQEEIQMEHINVPISEPQSQCSIDVPQSRRLQRPSIADLQRLSLSKGISPLFNHVMEENVEELESILAQNPDILNTERVFGDTLIHIATQAQKLESLKTLLKNGAQVTLLDSVGETALHSAVAERWQDGILELLQHGASPDKFSEPKSPIQELCPQTALHIAVKKGDNQSAALLLRKSPDLSLCDGLEQTILHMAAQAHSIKLLTRLLHDPSCHNMISQKDVKGNSVLHVAIQNSNIEEEQEDEMDNTILKVVDLLIKNGIDVNSTNLDGESPVYIAAKNRLPKVAKKLFESGADLSKVTNSKNSVLHAACESDSSDCLNIFFGTGKVNHFITERNKKGMDPFNLAIEYGSRKCCESLLNNGDHLGYRDNKGETRCSLILEKIPNALELLKCVFNKHVGISKLPQNDPNFFVEFDYSVILRPEFEELQCSLISKLTVPQIIEVLKHPLMESFLHLKWRSLRFMFYIFVFIYFTFLMVHSYFVFYTFGSNDKDWKNDETKLQLIRIIHIILYVFFLIPGTCMVLLNTSFMKQRETYYITLSVIASAFVVFSPNVYAQRHTIMIERPIAAISAVVSWGEFTLLLGKFPKFGEYISMLSHVAVSMFKVFIGFSSLLIGFGISFSILYNDQNVFSSFTHSMVKILMMMIGEYNYVVMPDSEDAADKSKNLIVYFGSILLILFVLLVSVLMTNLLIGVAVYDIGELIRHGKIERLFKQSYYIISYENCLKFCLKHNWGVILKVLAKVGEIEKYTKVYPNRYESIFKKIKVPVDAIEEAINIKSIEMGKKEEDFQCNEDTDIAKFMKNFRAFYMTNLHKRSKLRETEAKQRSLLLDRVGNLETLLQSHLSNPGDAKKIFTTKVCT